MHRKSLTGNSGWRIFGVIILLGSVALGWQAPARAADWLHFRGPAMDGNSLDAGLAGDEVTEVWSTMVHNGCSSVTIAGGKLYTMGNAEGKESVVCLDAASGEPIWQFSYDCELNPKLYPGGPNATPTLDDGRAYTISRTGQIFCLDAATGEKIWEASAAKWLPSGGWWGFSCSPTIIGDVVYYNVGEKGLALNKNTGKVVWSSGEPAKAYSTVVPLPQATLGRAAIVVQTTTNIHILDPSTGEALMKESADWRSRASNCNGVSPRWYQGGLYLVQGKQGLSKLSLRNGTWAEDWLCAQAAYTNDWFAFNQQVLHDGFVLTIAGDAQKGCRLVCIDTQTGEPAWEKPAEFGNLLLVGDTLLMLSQTGELAWGTLQGSEYREAHRSKPLSGGLKKSENGVFWPYPVLLDGYLYAKTTKGHLSCLKIQ